MSGYDGEVWVLTYGWKKSNAAGGRRELFSHKTAVKRHIDDVLAAQLRGEHEVRDFKVWSWDGKGWGEHELTPGWHGVEIGGASRTMRVRWAPSAVADALDVLSSLHAAAYCESTVEPRDLSEQTLSVAIDCLRAALGVDE